MDIMDTFTPPEGLFEAAMQVNLVSLRRLHLVDVVPKRECLMTFDKIGQRCPRLEMLKITGGHWPTYKLEAMKGPVDILAARLIFPRLIRLDGNSRVSRLLRFRGEDLASKSAAHYCHEGWLYDIPGIAYCNGRLRREKVDSTTYCNCQTHAWAPSGPTRQGTSNCFDGTRQAEKHTSSPSPTQARTRSGRTRQAEQHASSSSPTTQAWTRSGRTRQGTSYCSDGTRQAEQHTSSPSPTTQAWTRSGRTRQGTSYCLDGTRQVEKHVSSPSPTTQAWTRSGRKRPRSESRDRGRMVKRVKRRAA
ncbi:hypothetical protein JB92DRAFT_2952448 [Gautieria morchelliformis]|nr:hypothetical protein JB92DRAFT_2952448 [Gautieria morchelliformis]